MHEKTKELLEKVTSKIHPLHQGEWSGKALPRTQPIVGKSGEGKYHPGVYRQSKSGALSVKWGAPLPTAVDAEAAADRLVKRRGPDR